MKRIFMILLVLLAVSACVNKPKIISAGKFGNLEQLNILSLAIGDNTIKEPNEKMIYVLLPPEYNETKARYPVIYYFHGHGSNSTEILSFEKGLYKAMADKKVQPFIVVSVNGDSSLGGSFYVNSARTGRWQDYISDEIVQLIDGRYRTIASASARGLIGFSMGGFGVLNMGLSRPDLFAGVWALCPGVFVPEKGLKDALPTWSRDAQFLKGYSSAFSDGVTIPVFDGSPEDSKLVKELESGFGNWEERIDRYLKQDARLTEFRIIFAKEDVYAWITEGSQYLASYMSGRGINTSVQGYPIMHAINAALIIEDAMPFFERILQR